MRKPRFAVSSNAARLQLTEAKPGQPVLRLDIFEETTVLIASETSFDTRYRHMRAGVRLNSRVPVVVEWVDGGRNLRADGYTVDVSPKGCLAIVPQGFTMGQKLRLINMVNQQTSEAVVIWRGHEGRTGWELGLEILGKTEDFWGLDL